MVVRLIGDVNGQNVIFQKGIGDIWQAQVPSSLDGTYVIEMTAYDEAGNEAYWARYIMTVDIDSLCVILTRHPYQADILNGYTASVGNRSYGTSIDFDWTVEKMPDKYYAKAQKGECCNHAC